MSRVIRSTMLLAAVALILVSGTPLRAAQNCFLKIEGQTQGWIRGDSTIGSMGREDHIEGLEYHHLMEMPSGGTAVNHQTVIITKRLDRSTPSLLRAMDNSEQLTVQIRFFRPDPGGTGAEQEFYEVLLEDARLVSIEPLKGHTLVSDTLMLPDTERLRFSYGRITVTWIPTGSVYSATSNP